MGYRDEEFEDSEDEEMESLLQWKDYSLFVVDASHAMTQSLDQSPNTSTHLQLALTAIKRLLSRKATRSADKIGVLLYGTRESKRLSNMSPREHTYLLLDLQSPDVQDVLTLERFLEHPAKFDAEIGSSKDYELSDVFWSVAEIFAKTRKEKGAFRRAFLITNEDAPHMHTPESQRVARIKAKDLQANDITLELFPLNKPHTDFHLETFYSRLPGIASEDLDDEEEKNIQPCSTVKELESKITLCEHQRRFGFRVPMQLYAGIELGVRGTYLYKETKKPTHVYLEEKTNQEVETLTTYASAANGEIILRNEIMACYEYGGQKAVFEQSQIKAMKHFGEPGLLLLGFKHKNKLKFKHNLKNSCLITADEESIVGSTCLFANLVAVMNAKEQMAICRLIASKNANPRLVALVPQMPDRQHPDVVIGLNLIHLPFADDIRHIDPDLAPPVSFELIQDMKHVIEALTFPNFDFSIRNPELQKLDAGIRSVALELDEMEPFEDETVPKVDWIASRAGSLISDFNRKLDTLLPHQKRPLSQETVAEPAAKKPKGGPLTLQDLQARASTGRLKSCTVAQLSEFLDSVGIKAKKKKEDVLEQVQGYLSRLA